MGLRVTFDLTDNDLKHFRLIMREARSTAARIAPEDIVAAAEELLTAIGPSGAPAFIIERLEKLRLLIDMLSDLEWRLPHEEANRVLSALAYFTEPEDLIPDHIPGLGFLDDAIMIELIARELKHEIEAYQDFCDYRKRIRDERGGRIRVSRDQWLEDRRQNLQTRMRRRKRSDRKAGRVRHINLFR
ncbi:MAG: YkvA family protein [Woeseiaceae bacterium]